MMVKENPIPTKMHPIPIICPVHPREFLRTFFIAPPQAGHTGIVFGILLFHCSCSSGHPVLAGCVVQEVESAGNREGAEVEGQYGYSEHGHFRYLIT